MTISKISKQPRTQKERGESLEKATQKSIETEAWVHKTDSRSGLCLSPYGKKKGAERGRETRMNQIRKESIERNSGANVENSFKKQKPSESSAQKIHRTEGGKKKEGERGASYYRKL